MKSVISRRRLTIQDREVHVRLEHLFWTALEEIAHSQATTTSNLVALIDASRADADLSSAIRSHVLHHFRRQMQSLDDMADGHYPSAQQSADGNETDAGRPRRLN